jgi:uncharacterized protein YcbX
VPQAGSARMPVTVWHRRVDAARAIGAAEVWISELMGRDCRLVYMDAAARRNVDPRFAAPGDELSFADGCPLLLTSTASLADLNSRLMRPASRLRFRPNRVIAGVLPHAEDDWTRIRAGAVEFEGGKPCARCIFTTVDLDAGEVDAEEERLCTLTGDRRTREGVLFGVNLIARGTGPIRVGDPVQVLDWPGVRSFPAQQQRPRRRRCTAWPRRVGRRSCAAHRSGWRPSGRRWRRSDGPARRRRRGY